MRSLLFLAFVAMAAAHANVEPNMDKMIDYINNLGTTWTAGHNFPKDMNLADKRRMMTGLLKTPEAEKAPVRERRVPAGWVAPDSFDAREEWADCPTIPQIQDQGSCGSCWAVAAATVMSDRACIHSGGTENFQYSMENLLACSDNDAVGSCDGGYIDRAFGYWVDHGICSGGPYGSGEGCQDYTIRPTGYGIFVNEETPACRTDCNAGYGAAYEDDLRYGQDHYAVPQDEEEIKYEIMTNGPVEVGFTVYLDFEMYTGGVYQHEINLPMGGHAVRMLGWGVENGTPYWLCANSWNVSWGETGYFKILRGSNECGIEEEAHGGTPKAL